MVNYSIGELHPKSPGVRALAGMVEELSISKPEYVGLEIGGLVVVGKHLRGTSKYLVQKSGEYYYVQIKEVEESRVEVKSVSIDTIKLGSIEYDPAIFVPMLSRTALDYVFSRKGGIMPATNYIVVGDPGIGKSTLSIDFGANVQSENLDKRVLFISAEMSKVDMYEYIERFPKWRDLNAVFLSEFVDGEYKSSLEELIGRGWDLVVGDSFAEINNAVQEDYNSFCGGKMGSGAAERWLIDLMAKSNIGDNERKCYTSFVMIQQVTKGGKFVGSNKLKHNTTGMIELRYTKGGEKKIVVEKNRRGWEYQDLHFSFGESGIEYDIARIEREKDLESKIHAEREELLNDERLFDRVFGREELVESDSLMEGPMIPVIHL